MSESSFTGRKRRATRRGVRIADRVSRLVIVGGGIGTIVAVSAILLFLVYVVVPLFHGATVSAPVAHDLAADVGASRGRAIGASVDEYGHLVWRMDDRGTVRVWALSDGSLLREEQPFDGAVPTAWAFDAASGRAAFGFADGTLRLATLGFEPRFLSDAEPPPELADLGIGEVRTWKEGVVERTPEGQLRAQGFAVAVGEPLKRDASRRVVGLDLTVTTSGDVLAALGEDGRLSVYRLCERRNLMTGKTTISLQPSRVPYEPVPGDARPRHLLLSTLGDVVYLVWADGRLLRFYHSPADGSWSLAETLDLVEDDGAQVTALHFLVGKGSLAVGDSLGHLNIWFRSRLEGEAVTTSDGFRFVVGHRLLDGGPAVTALGVSSRNKTIVTGHEDGTVQALYVTSESHLATTRMARGPVESVALYPRDDAILATAPGLFTTWSFDGGYPEVSLSSLFAPVWYEGYAEPAQVWQSTGATNEFEAKFGLMPLVFGTLKATLYSLLFGVPIAILAALFTSEFLTPRVKVPIKSTIEVMASLPSVVLGFLAALVIAPFVQVVVPSVLTTFLTIPGAFLLGAYLWQLLPQGLSLWLAGWPRFFVMVLALVVGVWSAGALGPVVEDHLFWVAKHQEDVSFEARADDGRDVAVDVVGLDQPDVAAAVEQRLAGEDRWLCVHDGRWGTIYEEGEDYALGSRDGATFAIRRLPGGDIPAGATVAVASDREGNLITWLDQPSRGPATGGWMMLTLPLMALLCLVFMGRVGRPYVRRISEDWGRAGCALADLARFLLGAVVVVFVAWLFGAILASQGFDPRGSLVDTYIQRNALIVGFVMGFAIIPIVYTLAEDALSSVPSHLREGSLGAGATPWQTATRIIMPTAMSGLFSAVMIGLGRAVGETMIVLMAAGNTPIMDLNVFSGFRTLSANIAVELPEAVRGDTHYRTLFLAALLLFAMTFVVNTAAEAVRQRFRKRAFQL